MSISIYLSICTSIYRYRYTHTHTHTHTHIYIYRAGQQARSNEANEAAGLVFVSAVDSTLRQDARSLPLVCA